ncbi:hypothetical protein C2G38_2216349 [Gigaspora rosea]|uniref:DNA polymerase delta catalytic subunit n=1 Tax=Gigaspora rosea TaxID=44941 RepID=A0A397UD89_9GLOM|nr:hypothetical protein C2G38_2216349 [Gigaspora rosea]
MFLFYVYNAEDASYFKEYYILRLYTFNSEKKKTIINIKIDYLFFDIKLTDIEKNTIESYIEEFDPDSYETFNSQPFDSTKKFNFICLYYKTLKERKEALNIIEKKEEYFNKHLYENTKEIKQEFEEFCQCYNTYSDDRTCHYRKIARENNLELVGWYRIYNHQQKSMTLDDIEKVIIQQAPELILLFWNIESSSMRGPGYLPAGKKDEDYVYMIQMDFFYSTQLIFFKRFCLSTIPIEQKAFISKYRNKISCDLKDFHIIILNSQEELLLKFAELFEKYSPAFEIGFNTSGYDWNFILKKVIKLNIENTFNRKLFKLAKVNIVENVRESIVKIYEKEIDEKMMKQYCGININNRNIKVNPNENLIYAVLNRCGLSGKVDLLYLPESSDNLQCIFIYANAIKFKNNYKVLVTLSHQLSRLTKISFNKCLISILVPETILKIYAVELAYYCSVDTLRLQELNLKRNIIGDYTQLASITCTTISNIFMNGVGCLVQNFYGRHAARNNMLISTRRKGYIIDNEKYEGGFVMPPLKENSKRPVADLDFISFYPNTIITYNISLDTYIDINDDSVQNVNIITDHGTIYGKFTKHENDANKMGLMAKMYKSLLEERYQAKENIEKYESIDKAKYFYYTSLSDILKIVLNLIYGETGYKYSPFYLKPVSSSVTASARSNIRKMIEFAREKGYKIFYRDTDLFFFSLPEHFFKNLDKKYKNLKEKNNISNLIKQKLTQLYWYEMTKLTILQSKTLEKEINNYLFQTTNQEYLKMKYEKTMWPVLFLQKKQYHSIIHKKAPNFDMLNLLLQLIACEITEIELKKISPCGFGSPDERLRCYGKCSRAKTLEFFVKRCRSLERNILLVINTILQNVKLTLFTSFGALDISLWFFRNFRQKVGNLAYPSKKSAMFTPPNLEMRLPNRSPVMKYENNQIIITEDSLKKRILQIIAKYIDDENLSVDLFKLTAKYDPTTNQRVKKCDYWNFEKRKELGDETKKGNKMDICASLLRCDEKKAEDIINQIFEENELKKQHIITDFYSEKYEQQKTTLILNDVQQKTTPKGKQQKPTLTSKDKQQKTTPILKDDQQKTTPISKDLKRKNTNEESNKNKKQKKFFNYFQKAVQNNELKQSNDDKTKFLPSKKKRFNLA